MSNMGSHLAYVTHVHRHSWSANSQSAGSTWDAKELLAASFLFACWVLAFGRGEATWSTNLVGACQLHGLFPLILLSGTSGRTDHHSSIGAPSHRFWVELAYKAVRIALPGSRVLPGTFGRGGFHALSGSVQVIGELAKGIVAGLPVSGNSSIW